MCLVLTARSCGARLAFVIVNCERVWESHGERYGFMLSPYEMTVWSEIELHELNAYIQRCLFLFQGLKEMTEHENDPNWEPTEAAHFAQVMVESVLDGFDFDMLAWEIM